MDRRNYDTVVFIDLRPSMNEHELAAICSEFGRVTLCEIIDDLPKIGIVSMENSKEAVSLLHSDKVRSICEFCAPLSQNVMSNTYSRILETD
ncbi:hypothetical protein D917_07102 [Trichinella nativa]|uniref:RRM domain-containing protein n=4 Tax=Trichinella TaxID=6333 RepID=A0A1Y3EUM2_9BILA|nr:hypothetical protein T05_10338 [Trichinella murrelli]KRX53131.1 hypothetical protein T09_66 [Trichinella sp. T9]KRX83422.1 hypothetical protein T06_3598 [Trichinella sp. T6]KRY46796.1 hypothetical protein T03_8320 [Trichinella britovi]OUC47219.1 hypothetical protein D917_07102 [Trichinella nativa]